MFTVNDLVEAAYRDDLETMERCLMQNMEIDSRARAYDSCEGKLREYPFNARFNKVHFAGWNSTWSNSNLENFTPLAAAIMGGHKHIVEFLINNKCDVRASVKIYSFTRSGGAWRAPFIDINMLGLSIITGNIEILNLICKQLINQKKLVSALNFEMFIDNVDNSEKLEVWELPFKLNDDAILQRVLQFIDRKELDISHIYRILKCRCGYNIHRYPALITSMQKIFSKDEVIDEVIKQKLIWDTIKPDEREWLIKQLDSQFGFNKDQIKTMLTQEVSENKGMENTMLHNAVLLNSTYLVNKLLMQHEDANVDLHNKAGNTALHLALLQPITIPEIIQCLIDHNASTGIRNNDRKTPLDLCKTPFLTDVLLKRRAYVKNKAINDAVVVTNTNEAQDTNRTLPNTCCCLFLPQFISRRFTKQKATENVPQDFELPTEQKTVNMLSFI